MIIRVLRIIVEVLLVAAILMTWVEPISCGLKTAFIALFGAELILNAIDWCTDRK